MQDRGIRLPTLFTQIDFEGGGGVAAECKLPLAPVRVLSIAPRDNAKSLHALWPIRATTSQLRQSGRLSCRHV